MFARRSSRPDALTPGPSLSRLAMLFWAATRTLGRGRTWLTFALGLCGIATPAVSAAVVVNWGAVITPVVERATFDFSRSNITKNFTDDYLFSLQGSTGATYSVTFGFSVCGGGCGNASLTYGIYDTNGGLVADSTAGQVTLAAGNYSLQVRGTGMGAGNSLDYSGSVTFSAAAASTVSAAPEPSTYLLTLIGLTLVGWVGHRNATSLAPGAKGRFAFATAGRPHPAT